MPRGKEQLVTVHSWRSLGYLGICYHFCKHCEGGLKVRGINTCGKSTAIGKTNMRKSQPGITVKTSKHGRFWQSLHFVNAF